MTRPTDEGPTDDGLTDDVVQEAGVARPFPTMKPGSVAACSMSLLVAGFLLTRGFIGFNPGRPLFLVLGVLLAVSATVGLAADHVAVRISREHPRDVLAGELSRSRRYGHPMTLVSVRCDPDMGTRIIARMRGCDRAWRDRGELRLLLSETNRAAVLGFVDRIDDLAPSDRVRSATFPDDALTVEGLERALAPVIRGPVALGGTRPTAVADLQDLADRADLAEHDEPPRAGEG